MKKTGILIKFETDKRDDENALYFMTDMTEREIREDIKQRVRQVLRDLFGGKKDYGDMFEAIEKKAQPDDYLTLYEKVAQCFQHSSLWDIISNQKADQVIGCAYWVIISWKERKFVVKEVHNDFNNLLDEIVKKKAIKVKKYTVAEMKKIADKVRNKLVERILNNNLVNRYEGLVKQNPFEYNGEQFIPIFDIKGKDAFDYCSKWLSADPKADRTFRGKPYSHIEFISADEKVNKGSKADIYLCFTDNKLYCPGNRTLFEFYDKRAFN